MAWRLCKSLTQLRKQINDAYPGRDKASDGSIGDQSHANRKSGHNPNKAGVVRAIDTDEDLSPNIHSIQFIVDAIIASRDPRILYIIYEGRMCSSYPVHGYKAWQWRPYSGANPHKHHAHIEVQEIPKLYDDARDWSIGSAPVHHASFEANSEKTAETANSPQSGADHTDEIYHVVSIGDTLTKIANTHSTTVDALKAINGLSGDLIRLGQRLRVK